MAKEPTDVMLIEISEERKVAVFNDPKEFDGLLKSIREKVAELKPDISTAKGRDEIRSMAFKVTRTKTAIDSAGKLLKEDWQKKVDAIDASRKRMRDTLDQLASQTRAPLTEWEEAEAFRVAAHEANISRMKGISDSLPPINVDANFVKDLQRQLRELHPGDIDYEEFSEQAEARYAASSHLLKIALDAAEERERQAAELAEMKRQQAEREAKEREERREREELELATRKAREQQAEIDRLTREKAEADRKAAESAEREAKAAEEAKRREVMIASRKAEEERAAKENAARIKKAKAERNDRLLETFSDVKAIGFSNAGRIYEDLAHELVMAIADGKIRHVTFG